MTSSEQHADVRNEQGLSRQLSAAQQSMMALGGAIGTGMFLASGLSVNVAGPAIILSYAIVAGVSLLLGRALTEMAVAHPTAGAFGVYAGMYVSPFASAEGGYLFRITEPGEEALVAVLFSDAGGALIKTHFRGTREAMTDAGLAGLLIRYPLLTFKVIAAIHYEALKLWLKGVPLTKRPAAAKTATKPATGQKQG